MAVKSNNKQTVYVFKPILVPVDNLAPKRRTKAEI